MTRLECRIASICQIVWRSVKPLPRYRDFLDFLSWRPPLSGIFWNNKFLTVGRVKRVELRHRAKFLLRRSNFSRDIAIFRFFRDDGRPPSRICDACVGTTHTRRAFGGLYHCAKFGWNRCSSFDNMHVFRFREFRLKTPIHAPKMSFLGVWPLNG